MFLLFNKVSVIAIIIIGYKDINKSQITPPEKLNCVNRYNNT